MSETKIWLHSSFVYGNSNSDYFTDIKFMTDDQLDLLQGFIDDVVEENPLVGRNKPSWERTEGIFIPHAEAYRQCNIWHYHAGPYSSASCVQIPNLRTKNYHQYTSDAVFHYTWRHNPQGLQNEVVILGYSPQHKQFPIPSDKRNPLRTRMKVKAIYRDNELIDPASSS